jgi:hypothetical protein
MESSFQSSRPTRRPNCASGERSPFRQPNCFSGHAAAQTFFENGLTANLLRKCLIENPYQRRGQAEQRKLFEKMFDRKSLSTAWSSGLIYKQ